MAALDTGLTVRLEQDGREFTTQIKAWSIDSAYLVSTDEFSFTLYSENRDDLLNLELQPVELIVNGASQGFGRIEVTTIGDDGSAVMCSGRDYISELVECNIDPFKTVAPETELGDAILDVMRPVGITGVTDFENVILTQVRSGVPVKRGNKGSSKRKNPRKIKVEEFKPKPGQGIYEFCNRLVARHGATLQPGLTRSEIVIDAPDYDAVPLFRLTRTNDTTTSASNNIVKASATRDYSRFTTYSVFTGTAAKSGEQQTALTSQFGTLEFAEALGLDEVVSIMQRATQVGRSREGDPNVLYRLQYHRDEDSRTQEQLAFAAQRAMADRLKDTLAFTCTVKGHVDPISGGVWSVGAIADVSDSITGVHEKLWIARRTLRYSTEGAMTDLELWRPGSFTINEEL